MKKSLIVTISIIAFILIPTVSFAQNAPAQGLKQQIIQKTQEVQQLRIERKDTVREQVIERIRTATRSHYKNFSKAITLSEAILSKLQIRIDTAKANGKDTAQIDTLMTDSNAKLADARQKLADLEAKKETAATKAEFNTLQTTFKAIRQDLQIVRQNSAKVISILKGYNSALSATNSARNK